MAEPDETPQKYEPLTGAKKAQYEADRNNFTSLAVTKGKLIIL